MFSPCKISVHSNITHNSHKEYTIQVLSINWRMDIQTVLYVQNGLPGSHLPYLYTIFSHKNKTKTVTAMQPWNGWILKEHKLGDFPGDPVFRLSTGSIPGLGTKIPHATELNKYFKRKYGIWIKPDTKVTHCMWENCRWKRSRKEKHSVIQVEHFFRGGGNELLW